MVEKLGESEAYYAYMQNDYDLLDEKELDEYVAEDEKKIEDIKHSSTVNEYGNIVHNI